MKKCNKFRLAATAGLMSLAMLGISCSSDSDDNTAKLLLLQNQNKTVQTNPDKDNEKPGSGEDKNDSQTAKKYTEAEFKRCYSDDSKKKEITFLLDTEMWGINEDLTNAHVRGSFTTWTDKDDFKLVKDSSGKFYSVTVPYSKLVELGNSGHPEYKFNTDGTDNGYLTAKDVVEEPYCFHTSDYNLILIYEGEDIEDIKTCSKIAGTWKSLEDWNLDAADDKTKERFANFRPVPGTTNVYRSWHPFKVKYHKDSGKKFLRKTEPYRVGMVTSLYEKYGIKTDICLSGDETESLSTYEVRDTDLVTKLDDYTESVPAYYQELIDAGNVCNVTYDEKIPEYKYIYQSAYDETFLNGWLKNMIDFVKEDHPAPYNIHCRLGNDRTGYYCAVVAGLCGATWEQIANDYQSSNNTCLGEYRDQRLLKQVFEKQFGIADLTKCNNLKEVMYEYYQKNDKLKISKADLDALVAKFTAK